MRRTSARRSVVATMLASIATVVAMLAPSAAQAAEYYELAQQTMGPSYCPGAYQSLTVWKKGVQENQIWSTTSSGGGGWDQYCQVGTTLTQVLYLVNSSGAVAVNYGATTATVTSNYYTTNAIKNVSYSTPVGWSWHLHSYTCYQGACSRLHVAAIFRIGPGTTSADWQVVTQVV